MKELTFPRKMLVWDNNKENARTRIVITILSNEYTFPVVAIDHEYEEEFIQKTEAFYTECFMHAEELPTLEMTMEEINNHFGRKIKIVEKHG